MKSTSPVGEEEAQIGAIHVAKQRLEELLDERGAPLVTAIMGRAIDVAEQQVRDLVADMPAGR